MGRHTGGDSHNRAVRHLGHFGLVALNLRQTGAQITQRGIDRRDGLCGHLCEIRVLVLLRELVDERAVSFPQRVNLVKQRLVLHGVQLADDGVGVGRACVTQCERVLVGRVHQGVSLVADGQLVLVAHFGNGAHATREEAEAEAQKMLHVYGDFAEKYMAVPVIKGVKSANERFAGALDTYTIEGLMQDGKALQCGTSHFLGQNFAKAFNVQFVDKNNKLDYVWATSWGVSTRLMGALIMTHSDDNGLVLPPHLAPIQVVIVPIYKNDEMLKKIDAKVEGIVNKLKAMGISVKYDNADNKRPGFKFADYELKGVPVRLVMGGRDLENNTMEVMRRDTLEKETRSCDGIEEYVQQLLEDIQNNIYQKALNYRNEHIVKVDSYDDFKEQIEKGGFILAHWDGTPETEDRIKEETKATIRCLPFDADEESLTPGKCMVTGKPSARRVLFARAY